MLVSIVIPVYNSLVLEELAERIERVFDELDDDFEIIFVDDCSPNPAVWPTLERLAAERARVRALQLTRNYGNIPATLCGFEHAHGDFVITMDDDLQHLPEDLPKFLEMRDWDIVIGQFPVKQHNLWKRAASRVKGYFDRIILDKPVGIQLTSYRMLSRTVVDGVTHMYSPHPMLAPLMFYVSRKIVGVPVRHEKRKEGRSGFTLSKQLKLFSNLIINNSSVLLRAVGNIGILFSVISLFYAAWVVFQRLAFGIGMIGWPSLIATILLIGGLLLFSMGVVGEYLIRIIDSTERKPSYFVRRGSGSAEHTERDRRILNRTTAR